MHPGPQRWATSPARTSVAGVRAVIGWRSWSLRAARGEYSGRQSRSRYPTDPGATGQTPNVTSWAAYSLMGEPDRIVAQHARPRIRRRPRNWLPAWNRMPLAVNPPGRSIQPNPERDFRECLEQHEICLGRRPWVCDCSTWASMPAPIAGSTKRRAMRPSDATPRNLSQSHCRLYDAVLDAS